MLIYDNEFTNGINEKKRKQSDVKWLRDSQFCFLI